mmetsp:Transcript_115379/g.326931  ORF Transcript_115379/g.326931 Transcript_115379/m.326931 type:complete len:269 (-) Transcript_115379:415-1221(-)
MAAPGRDRNRAEEGRQHLPGPACGHRRGGHSRPLPPPLLLRRGHLHPRRVAGGRLPGLRGGAQPAHRSPEPCARGLGGAPPGPLPRELRAVRPEPALPEMQRGLRPPGAARPVPAVRAGLQEVPPAGHVRARGLPRRLRVERGHAVVPAVRGLRLRGLQRRGRGGGRRRGGGRAAVPALPVRVRAAERHVRAVPHAAVQEVPARGGVRRVPVRLPARPRPSGTRPRRWRGGRRARAARRRAQDRGGGAATPGGSSAAAWPSPRWMGPG